MIRPQLLALAHMLESAEALISPEDYFRIRAAADFTRWAADGSGQFYTEFGPVRVLVARRLPEGFLMPGNGQGLPLFGVPASFPTEGPPEDWPPDWERELADLRYEITRGRL